MSPPTYTPFGYPPEDQPRPRILWKWSLAIVVLLFGWLMYQCGAAMVQGHRLTDGAVRHFHQEFNSGGFSDIYQEADQGFHTSATEEQILQFFRAVHDKLGDVASSSFESMSVNASTNGTFITVAYKTTFVHGTGEETFKWRKRGSDLKLFEYNLNSRDLILR